jgi:hypothetical protein
MIKNLSFPQKQITYIKYKYMLGEKRLGFQVEKRPVDCPEYQGKKRLEILSVFAKPKDNCHNIEFQRIIRAITGKI